MTRRRCQLVLILVLGLAAAVRAAEDASLTIVTSVFPLELIVREVGGERVAVSTLVPPGASPHAFAPLPRDMVRLARARYFVRVGGGFDDWTEKLTAGAPASLETVALLETDTDEPHAEPHAWLDPLFVRDALLPVLVERLSDADPGAAAGYRARAKDFADRLGELDEEVRAILATASGRRYVAFHNAWRHFARRYGLEEVGVVHESAGREPTPKQIAGLIRSARRARVGAILVEPQLSSRIAEVIAAEFGAGTVVVDPLGDPENPDRNSYEKLLRFDARAFAAALGRQGP